MYRRYRDSGMIKVLNPKAVVIRTPGCGIQIWTQNSRAQSRPHVCCLCEQPTERADKIWRPVTNAKNRMDRFCSSCMDRIIAVRLAQERS